MSAWLEGTGILDALGDDFRYDFRIQRCSSVDTCSRVSLRRSSLDYTFVPREDELGVGGDFRKMFRIQRFAWWSTQVFCVSLRWHLEEFAGFLS